MSGYRDTSNFDPYASPRYGKPLRPFNGVQWTGVALILFGLAMYFAYFAARLHWIRDLLGSPAPAIGPLMLGVALVNSRREELTDLAPELAADRRRWLIIVTLVCVVVFGAALVIDFVRS